MKSKELHSEQAILCDNQCGRDIQGKYIKMEIGLGFTQNYHESCAKQVQKLLDRGHKFARRRPNIVLVSDMITDPNTIVIRTRHKDSNNKRVFIPLSKPEFNIDYEILE